MIESEEDAITGSRRIVLKPNSSMTMRQAKILIAVLATAMGSIGLFFASMGAWLVLPFSGAEWLFLAYCFKFALRRSAVLEVITISEGAVRVEKGRGEPEDTYQFHRAWVNIDWVRSIIPGHPSRLYFRLHGRSVEIGGFLIESEREALALELQRILLDSR